MKLHAENGILRTEDGKLHVENGILRTEDCILRMQDGSLCVENVKKCEKNEGFNEKGGF